MGGIEEPVEDRVAEGRISDEVVPAFHWDLAAEDGAPGERGDRRGVRRGPASPGSSCRFGTRSRWPADARTCSVAFPLGIDGLGATPGGGWHGRAHANPPRCRSRHPKSRGRSRFVPSPSGPGGRACGPPVTARQPTPYEGVRVSGEQPPGAHAPTCLMCTP